MRVLRNALALAAGIAAQAVPSAAVLAAQNPSASSGGNLVTYDVTNNGSSENNLVVTFGSVFARGDVPRGSEIEAVDDHGNTIPVQVDRKASHPDGSLRHAVVTLDIPHLGSGGEMAVTLRRTAATPSAGADISISDLPAGFDTVVDLGADGRHLAVSARALLATKKIATWLKGPIVGEWWVSGPFKDTNGTVDPHLSAEIGIRSYGKGQPLRLDVAVENDWTFVPHPRTEVYDATIRAGGKTVFAKTGIIQPSQTRWRKGFWWSEPVSLYVKQNLDYLKKTHVVPNYEPGLVVSGGTIAQMYGRFENSDRDPMGSGTISKYMPTTGARPDVAPLPQWQAEYLLTMDPRAYQITLQNADLGASFPTHYRNEKTGLPMTVADDPDISVAPDLLGHPGQPEKPDAGGLPKSLVPDAAHQPALDFIPYLVTGDRFYLEELQFWSQWNTMFPAPEYRGRAAGLISWGAPRVQAWSLRTLAQAAYITPDSDPLKSVLLHQLKANIAWYEQHFSDGPANKLGILADPSKTQPTYYDNGRSIAPWQDDYFTWSVGYVQDLGDVDALPLLRWKARFPVGRMTAPGFCWILAAPYFLRVRDEAPGEFYTDFAKVFQTTVSEKNSATNLNCAAGEMGNLSMQGNMIQVSRGPDAYAANLQAALAAAVNSGVPGAESAWKLFETRPVKPNYALAPAWDIVPWSIHE